jgi:hypothetical protein
MRGDLYHNIAHMSSKFYNFFKKFIFLLFYNTKIAYYFLILNSLDKTFGKIKFLSHQNSYLS